MIQYRDAYHQSTAKLLFQPLLNSFEDANRGSSSNTRHKAYEGNLIAGEPANPFTRQYGPRNEEVPTETRTQVSPLLIEDRSEKATKRNKQCAQRSPLTCTKACAVDTWVWLPLISTDRLLASAIDTVTDAPLLCLICEIRAPPAPMIDSI